MVKHIQTIRRLLPTNRLSVFDHLVGSMLKGLIVETHKEIYKTWDSKWNDTGNIE